MSLGQEERVLHLMAISPAGPVPLSAPPVTYERCGCLLLKCALPALTKEQPGHYCYSFNPGDPWLELLYMCERRTFSSPQAREWPWPALDTTFLAGQWLQRAEWAQKRGETRHRATQKRHGRPRVVTGWEAEQHGESRSRGAAVRDRPAMALHVAQLLLQPGILLLLLQQPPLHSAQLLLGLTLDVIGHHHRGLQVCLEPPPLLGLLLQTPGSVPKSDATRAGPRAGAPGPLCPTLRKTGWAVLREGALLVSCHLERAQVGTTPPCHDSTLSYVGMATVTLLPASTNCGSRAQAMEMDHRE